MSHSSVLSTVSVEHVTTAEVSKAMHFSRDKKNRGSNSKVASGEWSKICRGAYLETQILQGRMIWHQRRIVAIARALAIAKTGQRIISGLSAAVLNDLPMLHVPQDITAHLCSPAGTVPTLPAVWMDQTLVVPSGLLTRQRLLCPHLTHEAHIQSAHAMSTIMLETLPGSLLTIARTAEPEEAFVALCMGLHQASAHDHVRCTDDKRRVERARTILLSELDALPPMTHGVHRARVLIQAADGGCDSVAEARLLWILKTAGVQGIQTQHVVGSAEGTFYVDVAIPSVALAIEFDGFSKYDTSPLVHQQWSEQHRREQAIARQGYLVQRFQWENLNNPARMLRDLSVALAHRGQGLPYLPTAMSKMFGNDHL